MIESTYQYDSDTGILWSNHIQVCSRCSVRCYVFLLQYPKCFKTKWLQTVKVASIQNFLDQDLERQHNLSSELLNRNVNLVERFFYSWVFLYFDWKTQWKEHKYGPPEIHQLISGENQIQQVVNVRCGIISHIILGQVFSEMSKTR